MNRRVLLLVACVLAGCTSTDSVADSGDTSSPRSSSSSSSTSTSTSSTSTTSTSTIPPTTTTTVPQFLGEESIGTTVEGRTITAFHRGTPGGIVILVVGVIHGNEDDGLAIIDQLRTMPLPEGYDVWLMPAINPDGYANQARGNSNGVDLNRNFPHDWTPIAAPGEWEYSGTEGASEPETQAFIDFAGRINPALTIWYHQDLHTVSPSSGKDGPLRRHYAERTGLDYTSITGGTYTGVAATWVRRAVPDAMSFIVELGPTLSAEEAALHATVVLEVAQMVKR